MTRGRVAGTEDGDTGRAASPQSDTGERKKTSAIGNHREFDQAVGFLTLSITSMSDDAYRWTLACSGFQSGDYLISSSCVFVVYAPWAVRLVRGVSVRRGSGFRFSGATAGVETGSGSVPRPTPPSIKCNGVARPFLLSLIFSSLSSP